MLFENLKAEQSRRGVKDKEFAALLGIPRNTWTMTRLGHKRMGPRVVRGAMAAGFFVQECINFLLTDATHVKRNVTTVNLTDESELLAAVG